MSDNVNVSPTPIQRNRRDVAIELLKIYLERGDYTANEITEDKLSQLYEKYFDIALKCDKK